MANKSRVILTENNRNHISRLIKSAQSLTNLEDYSQKPEGVWGSTATIRCNNAIINSSDLDFEFIIPFDDNLESNEGEIIIYNLSDNTLKAFSDAVKGKNKLTITAGYEGDTGLIFSGAVKKVFSKREGADIATTIKVSDGFSTSTEIMKEEGQESYDSVSAKEILLDLLEAERVINGGSFGEVKIGNNYSYENSVSIGDNLQTEIKKFSEVCGVSTFRVKDTIYCCKLEDVANGIGFNVSEEYGMIGSPSPFEEVTTVGDEEKTIKGFDIELLLQHRAAVGAIVNLKSEQYKGKYYIKSGTHRFNESGATTTVKVVEK